VARRERRCDPIGGVDFGHHALAIGGLAQDELHELRARGKASEPKTPASGACHARRVGRHVVQPGLRLSIAQGEHAVPPAFAHEQRAVCAFSRAKRESKVFGDLFAAALGPVPRTHAAAVAQFHQVVAPLGVVALARAFGDPQSLRPESQRIHAAQGLPCHLVELGAIVRATEQAHLPPLQRHGQPPVRRCCQGGHGGGEIVRFLQPVARQAIHIGTGTNPELVCAASYIFDTGQARNHLRRVEQTVRAQGAVHDGDGGGGLAASQQTIEPGRKRIFHADFPQRRSYCTKSGSASASL